jgi:hypothetical protein
MACGIYVDLNKLSATWPMSKPMWHKFKWVPPGKMQLVTNIVIILVARLFIYTLYGSHICIQ